MKAAHGLSVTWIDGPTAAAQDSAPMAARQASLPASGSPARVALCQAFGSITGAVVEASGSPTGLRASKVTVAIDCGTTINPDTVRAQVESSVLPGLSAALWGDMPFGAGQPLRTNFHSYRLGRLWDAPPIDVLVIESRAALGGVGEPALPPVPLLS